MPRVPVVNCRGMCCSDLVPVVDCAAVLGRVDPVTKILITVTPPLPLPLSPSSLSLSLSLLSVSVAVVCLCRCCLSLLSVAVVCRLSLSLLQGGDKPPGRPDPRGSVSRFYNF